MILSILSGLAIWLGFAPFEFWPGPYLGLFLLYQVLQRDSLISRVGFSFIAGLTFFGPLLHWSGSYVGALPWILLTVLQSLIFSSIGILRLSPWSFAALFTIIEIVRMKFPFGGFGWGRVGFTQIEPLHHIYPIIGITGITFLISLLAGLLNRINLRQSFGFTIILLLPLINSNIAYSSSIRVAAIQGGVDSLGLDFNSRAMSVFNRHINETKALNVPVDLIVWPENSADIDPEKNVIAAKSLRELAAQIKTPILVGAVSQGAKGPENNSILYNSDGEIQSKYQKQDLAPFGEYIPLRSIAQAVAPEAKRVRDFQPGRTWVFHEIAGKKFASVICFEILDDDLIRTAARKSDFLVAQTNNATFGTSPQARQQLQITRVRAAELGRDFAVVSTTGYTAKISATGSIESSLPQFESGVLTMEIRTTREATPASHIPSWLWVGVLGLITLWSQRSVFTR